MVFNRDKKGKLDPSQIIVFLISFKVVRDENLDFKIKTFPIKLTDFRKRTRDSTLCVLQYEMDFDFIGISNFSTKDATLIFQYPVHLLKYLI